MKNTYDCEKITVGLIPKTLHSWCRNRCTFKCRLHPTSLDTSHFDFAQCIVSRLSSIHRISTSLDTSHLDFARYIAFRLCSMHRIPTSLDTSHFGFAQCIASTSVEIFYMCRYIAIYIIMSFGKLISLYEGQFGRGWTRLHSYWWNTPHSAKNIFRMMPGRYVSL
jgi:hypothetical protein